ncbi:WAP four-disulfide core domain protein 5-like [Hyperolius riggenbachi]|uniref:WAP four-disulfide core domain protein 5-like n=1 Tax=Hyperolius riggenbachi TaxID=752182 RepID=UPI0035A305D9
MKCCNQCGKKCVLPGKYGICPVPPTRCPMPISPVVNQCENDFHCPGRWKCCEFCGKKCIEPLPVSKKGFCPKFCFFPICPIKKWFQCCDDWDCPGKKKCCHIGCGRFCVDPVGWNIGFCQDSSSLLTCAKEPCSDDWDCNNNGDKCCDDKCLTKTCSPAQRKWLHTRYFHGK